MYFGEAESDDECAGPSIGEVLEFYPEDCRPRRIENLGGAGGFSGAAFWRLATDRGPLCLRRWPPQVDLYRPKRLGFIHAVLDHVMRRGFSIVPLPIRTRRGEGFVQFENCFWELSAWLGGAADYFPLRRPEKLSAALAALAEFHLAAADFPGLDRGLAPSPGILRRRCQIERLRAGGLSTIAAAIDSAPRSAAEIDGDDWITIVRLARRLLPRYAEWEEPVLRQLLAAAEEKNPLQPCIRDVWHEHVLFEGDRVSGLVDFGAMRIDNVACDIARLLGSFSQGEGSSERGASVWQAGLAAYELVRPLSADERHLVGAFDRSESLLAGINWLEWIFVEGRTFENLAAVALRLGRIVARLEQLTHS